MKTKAWPIPERAKPRSNKQKLSGRPRSSEGPCKNIDIVKITKEMNMNSFLGYFFISELTIIEDTEKKSIDTLKTNPFIYSGICFSCLNTSVKNGDG